MNAAFNMLGLFDPSDVNAAYSFRRTSVTVGTGVTLVASNEPSRVGLILSVPTTGGTSMYLSPTRDVAVNTGIRLDSSVIYREYLWPIHSGLAQAAWYGIVAFGTQAMTVLECFYTPGKVVPNNVLAGR